MHSDEGVEGYKSVNEGLPKEGDSISTHSNEETGVGPHHATCSPTGDGDPVAGKTSEADMFSLERVVWKRSL